MIDARTFGTGLTRLALAVRETIDAPTVAVYHEVLGERTTPDEWRAFIRAMTASPPRHADGRPRFPAAAELLDALAEFRGRPSLEGEAVQAYERVLASSVYTPEGGASWTYRQVRERCGAAAAEAFLAAGGHHAFATTWDEARRRERFVAAYRAEARERPDARLLPLGPGEPKQLSAGEVRPTRSEATAILRRIADYRKGDESA